VNSVIYATRSKIVNVEVDARPGETSIGMTLHADSRRLLDRVLSSLRAIDGVDRVNFTRIGNSSQKLRIPGQAGHDSEIIPGAIPK